MLSAHVCFEDGKILSLQRITETHKDYPKLVKVFAHGFALFDKSSAQLVLKGACLIILVVKT